MSQNIPGLKGDLDNLETGDILLFGDSPYWFGRVVSYFAKSPYSHVAIVLRNPTYIDPSLKGLYVLESGIESFPDSEDHVKKFGVQITSVTELLTKSSNDLGYLTYRKLNTTMSKEELEAKIKEIHEKVHDKPYDIDLLDFIDASNNVVTVEDTPVPVKKQKTKSWSSMLSWFVPSHRKTDTFFCSALVGCVYTYLGFLPSDTKWSECTPAFFSSVENPDMKLVGGSYLGPDTLIYQNPNLKQI